MDRIMIDGYVDLRLDRDEFFEMYGHKKSVSIFTLGCKVNQYETEAMAELFENDGYEVVPNDQYANVYVINTCTVTNLGDKKSRQFIRRAKRLNDSALVAVVGCYSQVATDDVMKIDGVNLIIGTNERKKIVEMLQDITVADKICCVGDIMQVREFEELQIENMKDKTRAFLKIQDGCNQYCSYCIIPYARGPIRSRKPENIIAEVKRLVANGFKEFVLTGIHVASYGKDVDDMDLLKLLKIVHDVDGLERIRLSSVEPTLLSDEFMDVISKMPKFCNHFHLSMQSGSDSVLKRMNRKYTTAEYFEIVEKINSRLENPSITTDVIVGFPGETDDEFEETYEFVRKVGFYQIHVFKYSPKIGTPAAKMTDQIDGTKKATRSEKLISLGKELELNYLNSMINKKLNVLFEGFYDESEKYIEGLTQNYLRILVKSDINIYGEMREVTIKSIEDGVLYGEMNS